MTPSIAEAGTAAGASRAISDDVTRGCNSLKRWLASDLKPPKSPTHKAAPVDPRDRCLQTSPSSPRVARVKTPDSLDKGSLKDNDVLPPAPLHVIEAMASQNDAGDYKPKRGASTWSVSDLEESKDEGQRPATSRAPGTVPLLAAGSREASCIPLSEAARVPASKMAPVVGSWLGGLAEHRDAPPESSKTPAFRQGDLDSDTGSLLPAIQYPETLRHTIQGPCRNSRDIAWRQANMTSELQITRELRSRQRLAQHLRASILQNQLVKYEAPVVEEKPWPNAECTLRPATPADFQQIAEIINLESEGRDCPQVLESKTVDASDIDQIFRYCEANMRPLIVASPIEEDMLDRSKWPKNSERAYQEFVKFKKSQASEPPPVVGFAFVTEPRLGFLNAPCPGSRHTGQVRVIVHPEHRRKSYGTALLDRILLCLSPLHRSLIDYEWKCPNPARIHASRVADNDRQYVRVYMEVFCEGRTNDDFKWRAEMFGKFNFEEVAHLRQAVEIYRPGVNKWLDLVLWEFEAQPASAV